jgi:hypothetical protein
VKGDSFGSSKQIRFIAQTANLIILLPKVGPFIADFFIFSLKLLSRFGVDGNMNMSQITFLLNLHAVIRLDVAASGHSLTIRFTVAWDSRAGIAQSV